MAGRDFEAGRLVDPAPFQFSLLTPPVRPVASPRASVQTTELVRVESRIGAVILAWCERHVGREFHLSQMTSAVMAETLCAPDSPRRILLQLRESGHVDVDLLERGRSFYRVRSVNQGGGGGEHATGP